jgi:signal transduction histidine kinase
MTVRTRLALTVLLAGLLAALGVIATVVIAFQRFEQESTWQRADAFVERLAMQHADLLEQHARAPDDTADFLRSLLLYEPSSQLYLLAGDGTVLASTGKAPLPAGFKVRIEPVREAAMRAGAYVMGDDPETMDKDAVVAARALSRSVIRPAAAEGGYLYLVCTPRTKQGGQWQLFGSTLVMPALVAVAAAIAVATALAAWAIGSITRPLKELSDEVARAAREGFTAAVPMRAADSAAGTANGDEFARLSGGFHALLATLHRQWAELKRLDAFRRESVSNLSHDLRSPLTATAACLETLQQQHAEGSPGRHLVDVALRNTHNAAALVRSLGDLALLDEAGFRLKPMRVDLAELLDGVTLRYAERARSRGVALALVVDGAHAAPLVADVDIELFERALANLLDNALKFTAAGGRITVEAARSASEALVTVRDSGIGIAAADLPHLFDRHFKARSDTAPASSEEGKGLGLAIVQRIAELHGGRVAVASTPGEGTVVSWWLPLAAPAAAAAT